MKKQKENIDTVHHKDGSAEVNVNIGSKKDQDEDKVNIQVDKDGNLFNPSGPSLSSESGMEIWTNKEGYISRLDGPAIVDKETSIEKYYINNVSMSKEEHATHPEVIKFNKLKNKQ